MPSETVEEFVRRRACDFSLSMYIRFPSYTVLPSLILLLLLFKEGIQRSYSL
jgi:hypothetical protein